MKEEDEKENNSDSPLSPAFAARLSRCQRNYREHPADTEALECLRKARRDIADLCLSAAPERLQSLFSGGLGAVIKTVYESDVVCEAPTAAEAEFCDELTGYLDHRPQDPGATNRLLAAMLYLRADQLPLNYSREAVPLWFFPVFVRYLVAPPKFFRDQAEISGYRNHLVRTLEFFARILVAGNHRFAANPGIIQELSAVVLTALPLHPVYFENSDLKALYVSRGALLEQSLRRMGCDLDWQPALRNAGRERIRVGIFNVHFLPQTETFATLPVFEHLDRSRFEIYLYAFQHGDHPIERYCRERADRYFQLSGDLPQQISVMRGHDLDILFFGSNITAGSSLITSIAQHRIARAQATSICSPVTTGLGTMDYYIAGTGALAGDKAVEQYRERLVTLDGSGFCFSFHSEEKTPAKRFSRAELGIPENAVVFVSGANFFKIIPALREAWTDIIAAVPGSVLLLYPFNPYWAGSYPAGRQLLEALHRAFHRHGIGDDRLVVHPPLPHRVDIKALLATADLYLDAFPYSGATSLIDPLETGLPTVVMDGSYLRFRQAGALLRELGMEELVTDTEQAYRALAARLGGDADYRRSLRNRITEAMSRQPAFLDARAFSAKMGAVFERIFAATG